MKAQKLTRAEWQRRTGGAQSQAEDSEQHQELDLWIVGDEDQVRFSLFLQQQWASLGTFQIDTYWMFQWNMLTLRSNKIRSQKGPQVQNHRACRHNIFLLYTSLPPTFLEKGPAYTQALWPSLESVARN